ncbi:hypothetical protein C3942_07155 [Solimonas fluminis]|uniref:Uncharacterized protein n=1 Tax=Solimonas fluminis TaxID=2086571 RepID=A0A2S5THS2_9GAMM|nr:hypothetical protein [Solimonas fluminis]PPE74534.1 hypothetical protein C3942_07155 [Solimonas fluminis]
MRVFSIYAAVLVALTIGAWELVFDGGAKTFKVAPAGPRVSGESSLAVQAATARLTVQPPLR